MRLASARSAKVVPGTRLPYVDPVAIRARLGASARGTPRQPTGGGAQGPQGVAGAQGSQGDDGAQGPQGDDGAQGPQGVAGAQGVQGDDGAQGPQGDDGAQGPQGVAGAQGAQGDDGAQGPQGDTGAAGGDAWSAFTITTVTEGVGVEYALPIDLPDTPTDGDTVKGRFRLRGMYLQGVNRGYLGQSLGDYEAEAIYEFVYTTLGGWELQFAASDLLGPSGSTGTGTLEASAPTPETRETIPIIGTTFIDDDGLIVFYAEWSHQQQHTFPA